MFDIDDLRATLKIKGVNMPNTVDEAALQICNQYKAGSQNVEAAYVNHIYVLLDKHKMGDISFEDFVNFMTICSVTTNMGILMSQKMHH